MSTYLFHDQMTLAQQAEELGKTAIKLGLIPSLIVRYYSDSQEFFLPEDHAGISLTAPEAYMKLKKIVEGSLSQV